MDFQYHKSGYRPSYSPTFFKPNLCHHTGLNYSSGVLSGQHNFFTDFNHFFNGFKNPFKESNNGFLGDSNPRKQANLANPTVNADLVEVGYYTNGKADQHAQSVMDVYIKNNPQGQNHVQYMGIDNEDPDQQDSSSDTTAINSQQDLDAFIDNASSSVLNAMADKIKQILDMKDAQAISNSLEIASDSLEVVNGSLGYSRNNLYEDILMMLKEKPNLATGIGLNASDCNSLQADKEGRLVVPSQLANAVVTHVDQRMDQQGSAYQKSLVKYQDTVKKATAHGVTVVVAAGNDHELNHVFKAHKLGGDTNFLAQSDDLISVAATDDNGVTAKVASFSSYGDDRYNPTVSAKGVDVSTPFGKDDGTSFAAPQVAALIARMEQENPNLRFSPLKNILQRTATTIVPSSTLATGAGMVNPDLAVHCAQQMRQFEKLEQLG